MKNILGHKSWNQEELIGILQKGGTYTMPNLPHYRYQRVKALCWEMESLGLLRRTGRTETGISFVPTDLFKKWRTEEPHVGFRKFAKIHNPPPPPKVLHHKCKYCKTEFDTFNHLQKFCTKICKSKFNIQAKGEKPYLLKKLAEAQ